MKRLAFLLVYFSPYFIFAQVSVKKQISQKGHTPVCLDYSIDGAYMASGGMDSKIYLWNASDYTVLRELKGIKNIPLSIKISNDNKWVLSAGKDKKLRIWDLQSGELVQTFNETEGEITSIAITDDNSKIAVGSKDKLIYIFEPNKPTHSKRFSGHLKEVNSVDFNSSGDKVLSGSADGTVKEWQTDNAQLIRTIQAHKGWVRCVQYSPDNSLIASGGDDAQINIYNAVNGELLSNILAHKNWVQTIQFSPDGKYLASGGHDNYVILLEAQTGRVIFNSDKREYFIVSLAFSPNGKELLSNALYSDKLTLWDLSSLGVEASKKQAVVAAAEVKKEAPYEPQFKVVQPSDLVAKEVAYRFQFSASTNEPLNNVEIKLNNANYERINIANTQKKWDKLEQVVYLQEGINSIQLVAYYQGKAILSDPITIKYFQPKATEPLSVSPSSPAPSMAEPKASEVAKAEVKEEKPLVQPEVKKPEPEAEVAVVKEVPKVKEPVSELMNVPQLASEQYNRFALIIGNEDYNSYQVGLGSEVNVDFAVNDATAFKEYAQKVFGVPKDNIIFLTNARAIEMDNGISKIRQIIKALNGNAEVLFFYAGHGFPDEVTKEPYIMPVDVTGSNLKFAIKLKDLYEGLNEFPSKRITVFIDACFSGGARNVGLVSARGVKIKPKESKLNGNFLVMSASSESQSSLAYKDKKHGMFTYHLLQKLKDAKGEISYKELTDYVSQQVSVKSVMINNKEQTPQVNISPAVEETWQNWRIK
jgi:WD40 repeat protein